ncbi:glycosyltransferase family A protein [Azospirillum isscasi]|uniref:Glycosyltransferase family A protein n=1 Tax=Azospirillum isscasi TaxID=3053926 RepID=A0ABU0WCX7_9PROT|nr:glycosyltransferase family A protein [Azospirillum isscasi]MDQ2101933.1 glycosyltransferase family A protein [Azospirillum isscasi]
MSTIGTVVIPCYGMASMVERALDSVAAAIAFHRHVPFARQGDIRIVVVDDASPDDSADRAILWGRRHREFEVLAIRSTRNRGAGAARNIGAGVAEGEYLWFLDADDELLPPHFAAGIVTLDNAPSVGAFCSQIEVAADIHPEWKPAIGNSSVFNLCIRRACHEYIGGFPETECFRLGFEDIAYRLFLSAAFKLMKSDIATVRYIWRPGNALDRQLQKLRRPFGDRSLFGEDRAPEEVSAYIASVLRSLPQRTDELPHGPPRRRPVDARDEWASFAGARFFDQYVVRA